MSEEIMNTKEVAHYLGIHEKQVYALIKSRRIPATRVTGKWSFPRKLIDEWIDTNARSGMAEARQKGKKIEGALLGAGSNDPILDLLQTDLRRNFPELYLFSTNIGSVEGLKALHLGYTDIAWSHLLHPQTGEYNIPYISTYLPGTKIVIVNLFYRDLGLIVPPGNPLKIKNIRDLGRKGIRFINRQAGSGTRLLIEQKLKESGISPQKIQGYSNEVNTHFEVGLSILSGAANVGIAAVAISKFLGLEFISLTRERFDMVIGQSAFFGKPVQAFIELLHLREFREKVERIGGYDLRESGRVIYSVN
jgi:putative molybdopterin biosynthesis protein